jgi:hypothetical protein
VAPSGPDTRFHRTVGGILLRKIKWSPIKAGAAIIGCGVVLTILILGILLILAIFKLRDIVN